MPTAELRAATGEAAGDGGVEHGELLVGFAEAVVHDAPVLDETRAKLLDALGRDGFHEAAATVGIFNGLVRVADSTGIPLDEGTRAASVDFRDKLGINKYGLAAQTDLDAPLEASAQGDVAAMFR